MLLAMHDRARPSQWKSPAIGPGLIGTPLMVAYFLCGRSMDARIDDPFAVAPEDVDIAR
jgi:hypothetical protein